MGGGLTGSQLVDHMQIMQPAVKLACSSHSHPLQLAAQLPETPTSLSHTNQRTPPRQTSLFFFSFYLPRSPQLPTVQGAGTPSISRQYFAIRHLMLLI